MCNIFDFIFGDEYSPSPGTGFVGPHTLGTNLFMSRSPNQQMNHRKIIKEFVQLNRYDDNAKLKDEAIEWITKYVHSTESRDDLIDYISKDRIYLRRTSYVTDSESTRFYLLFFDEKYNITKRVKIDIKKPSKIY